MTTYKTLLCLLFFLFPLLSFAQSKISYTYDESGNRIKREVPLFSRGIKQRNIEDSKEEYSERLENNIIKIYPNPTKGKLKVNITNIQNIESCHLNICKISGVQIYATEVKTEDIEIDLSNQPNGIYLLQVSINKKVTTWKIIKR